MDSLKGDCFNEAQSLGALQICGQASNVGCKYCDNRHPILPSSKNEVFCPKYGKRFFADENKTYLYSVHYKWLKETLCNIGSITVTQHQDIQQNLHFLGNINLLYAEYLVYLYCDSDFSFAEFNKIININPIDDNSIILSLNDTDDFILQSPYNFINLEHIISENPLTNNAFICTKTLGNHIKRKNRSQCKTARQTSKKIKKSDGKSANNFPRILVCGLLFS